MNKPLQKELWENIRTFAFDDPASGFPFSKKLQKENSWSTTFTADAIEEYRKFIFLCCILPNGASPSDTVDKVWHLHLTYTTNYWIDFCQKTLRKDIHHFPGKGGVQEKTKYANLYAQTLEKYKEVFGYAAPTDIWTASFPEDKPINIDIYDKDFFKRTVLIFAALTILFIAVLNIFHSKGPDFLVYYFVLMVAGLIASLVLQQHKSQRLDHFIDQQFPISCSPYQAANFIFGKHRAYQTALVDLLKRDIIDVTDDHYRLNSMKACDPKDENPLLPAVPENVTTGNTFTYKQGLELIDDQKLAHASFEHLASLSKIVDYQKFVIPGIVLPIGFARLFQGMANEKPVTYLVFEIGLFSLIALMIAAQYSYTYLVQKKSKSTWMKQNSNGYSSNILNNFTVLGVTAITGFAEYDVLRKVFQSEAPPERNSAGGDSGGTSSCSSGGDSGGDGGGGGGGCGGCGGGD